MRVPGDYACAKACVEGCEGHIMSYLELRDNVVRLPWPMRYGSALVGGLAFWCGMWMRGYVNPPIIFRFICRPS